MVEFMVGALRVWGAGRDTAYCSCGL